MSMQHAPVPQAAIIVGTPTRPGFNGQGTIDLNDFARLVPLKLKGCTFSHFEFVDLSKIDLDTTNFANLGIREDFDLDDRIDQLEVSFTNKGFVTTVWPPCRDSNGEWLEGRGRVTAGVNNNERWMPEAVYNREDTSAKNTITIGLSANLNGTLPSTSASYDDIVNGGVHLINIGELTPTVTDVNNWLVHDLELRNFFKQNQITKMRDRVIEISTRDESLILRKSTKEWHAWIKRKLELDKKEYVLVNASEKSYNTYIQRVWCESILPAIIDGTDPVDIIFYTSVYRPSEARTGLQMSIEKLDELYAMSFSLVKSQLHSAGIDLDALLEATGNSLEAAEKPFKIIGVCPQIVGSHGRDFEEGNLVDVSKY